MAVALPQAELFTPDAFPQRPDLVHMVKKKSFVHNASIVGNDEELCRGVCGDLLLGLSDRSIAKKWRISRNSIIGIEMVMRERGELEPLKKEISALLGECTVMGLRNYRDALAGGLINPAQIPIPVGVFIDKKGQLDAGVVPGTNLTQGDLTKEDLDRELAEMKRLQVIEMAPPDKQSDVSPTDPS